MEEPMAYDASRVQYVIEYLDGDGEAGDCHPDFFETREAAEKEAPLFMAHLPWAVSWRVGVCNL